MNSYNVKTAGKYEVVADILWKTHQNVKKYFWYNKKDIHNQFDVREYIVKELKT